MGHGDTSGLCIPECANSIKDAMLHVLIYNHKTWAINLTNEYSSSRLSSSSILNPQIQVCFVYRQSKVLRNCFGVLLKPRCPGASDTQKGRCLTQETDLRSEPAHCCCMYNSSLLVAQAGSAHCRNASK